MKHTYTIDAIDILKREMRRMLTLHKKELLLEIMQVKPKRYMRRVEAAKYLKVSLRKMDMWIAEGRVPVIRPENGIVLFEQSDLDAFLAKYRTGNHLLQV